MWTFLDNARQFLKQFVEIGFLAVLAILLIHLLLGEGAGPFVSGVAANVTKFASDVTAPGLLGIAILLAIVYFIQPRWR